MSHVYVIGRALVEKIREVLVSLSIEECADEQISRTATIPNVSFRKRRSAGGREDADIRINEGITVVPLQPVSGIGTNERDGVGYKFMIAIASGTYRDELDDTDANDWPLAEYEEAIRRRFNNKRICDLDLQNSCELRTSVEPGALPNWAKLKEGLDATFLVLTEYIREGRRDA